MRVLVACEFSGVVRDAFNARGHDAWSVDLLPGEGQTLGERYPQHYPPGHQLHGFRQHYQMDILELLYGRVMHSMALEDQRPTWDLMIAHPPCTDLAVSGARWFSSKGVARMDAAIAFVQRLMDAPIPRICIENPISIISSRIRKPDQIVQPWQFGHGETKATCLWLKGLPKLVPTDEVEGREARVHRMPPGPERWKRRSRTFEGIAAAMAEQWGNLSEDLV